MTVGATTLPVAANIFVWFMIVLPIVLVLIVAVMYIRRPRRSTEELEQSRQASIEHVPGSADHRRLPGA